MYGEALTPVGQAVYLHGFASSPASAKARWFAEALAARGVGFACPDLNQPAFETLTLTRMIGQARAVVATRPGDGPVALVGSSLGAVVALHVAAAEPRIDRLLLLAPALEFGARRLEQLGPHGLEAWRTRGVLEIFHHGDQITRAVGYGLYEDAARYDTRGLAVPQPVLAFQGRHDEVVDADVVARWAALRQNVTLHVVDDGHQLIASMPAIWEVSAPFFGLPPS